MEKNELSKREELKTYFETGKYPTQSQFSDLIDSLRLREDVLTNREAVALANTLASIDNGFISYYDYSPGDEKFQIVVRSQDEEDQIITLGKGYSNDGGKLYFFGNGPYEIKAKEFSSEGLKENEYYYFRYQMDEDYLMERLFGNNLLTIPNGYEFGTLEGKKFSLHIFKQSFEQKINIVNTNIKFVNKTEVPIQYRATAENWSEIRYTNEDIVTSHYDMWDQLTLLYKADLRENDQSILCKAYDADSNSLLTTGFLMAGLDNQSSWGGNITMDHRNIIIECDYGNIE